MKSSDVPIYSATPETVLIKPKPVDLSAALSLIFGDSSWIQQRLPHEQAISSFEELKQLLRGLIDNASKDDQIDLFRRLRTAFQDEMPSYDVAHEQNGSRSFPVRFGELEMVYEQKFGWPFLTFTEGTRHRGVSSENLIQGMEKRLHNPQPVELRETLLQLHRVVEHKLSQCFGLIPAWGYQIWDDCDALAKYSEDPNGITVTFQSKAHEAVAAQLKKMFIEAGFDEVFIDAIGNVVGRYRGSRNDQPTFLLTGSHYDTVRNGGAFDGRVGIFVPMEFVRKLSSKGQRLTFGIELVAFSEEEGVRFPATFLGSSALVGDFQPDWLNLTDADGISLQTALRQTGRASSLDDIKTLKRMPENYVGFVEVHIEQGPVLYQAGLPLGIVTAINGSRRYKLKLTGQASHAGTTPMRCRRDAACAAAEIILFVEGSACQGERTVATVGVLHVPNGSINTVPGVCELSLDIRAPNDEDRDSLVEAIFAKIEEVCKRRQVNYEPREVLRVDAAPCDTQLQDCWAASLKGLGLPVISLPSGAGHDAMKLHKLLPQAMLFVRGENNGISHNPAESTDSYDLQLAFEAFEQFCLRLSNHYTR